MICNWQLTLRIWSFVRKCERKSYEPLATVVERAMTDAKQMGLTPEKTLKKFKAKVTQKKTKWVKHHEEFRKKNQDALAETVDHPMIKLIRDEGHSVGLTDRELEASCLAAGMFLKKVDQQNVPDVVVGPCGDSLKFLKFRGGLHPCVLPSKKYLYILKGRTQVSLMTGN